MYRGGRGSSSVWRFAWRQLRAARGRTLATALAILVAAAGFVTLTSAVSTTTLNVHHLASSNYRPAYDILVRPKGSATAFERDHHLVSANYLSGAYGGITVAQWHTILRMDGVGVAAPIANVGYVALPVSFKFAPPTTSAPVQLYRIAFDWTTDNGLSRIPGPVDYVYITNAPFRRTKPSRKSPLPRPYQVGPHGEKLFVCSNYPRPYVPPPSVTHKPPKLPSPLAPRSDLWCNSTSSQTGPASGGEAVRVVVQFPVLLTGIDPAQEAKLMHLPDTVVNGDYLTEGAGLTAPRTMIEGAPSTLQRVPVLAARSTFVDQTLLGSITRVHVPSATGLAKVLASKHAKQGLAKLSGARVGAVHVSAQTAYRKLLGSLRAGDNDYVTTGLGKFWSILPARYRLLGHRHVAPQTTSNPASVWDRLRTGKGLAAPPGTGDTQFHKVVAHPGIPSNFGLTTPPPGATSQTALEVGLKVVGEYDPGKLPGFSALNKVPLQTYYPPQVTGATAHDRRLLGDKPLGPDMNIAGYVSQPPLLLTTIKAAAQMQNPKRYKHGHPKAPISSIRVRVAGVTGLNAESRAHVKQVAQAIATSTGLDVQITAGSSPTPVTVDLPAGKYGRPALQVEQGWVQQGAVTHLVTSVDVESLALFVLVLVAAVLLLANGINASVRARRTDLGVLAALGWTPRDLARTVRVEVLTVAGGAGVAGIGLAALLVWALGLDLAWTQTLLVLPAALVVALLAGWWPARAAARADPTLTVISRVAGRHRGRARRLRHLAWAAVARRPGRAVLGGLGLAIGVAAVTVLLAIELRFQGHVSTTLIGQVAILRVHGAELAAAALVAVFGAASVADVVGLDLTERAAEFAALAATGWNRGQLARLAAGHGVLLGGFGSLAGAVAGYVIGAILTASPGFVALTALVGLAGGTLLAVAATAVPVARAVRRDPARTLATSE